jgi:hypothetical protein
MPKGTVLADLVNDRTTEGRRNHTDGIMGCGLSGMAAGATVAAAIISIGV